MTLISYYNSGTDTLFDQCNSYIMINHLNLKRVRKSQNVGDVFSEENLPIVLCCITISYIRTDTDSHVCFNVAILQYILRVNCNNGFFHEPIISPNPIFRTYVRWTIIFIFYMANMIKISSWHSGKVQMYTVHIYCVVEYDVSAYEQIQFHRIVTF